MLELVTSFKNSSTVFCVHQQWIWQMNGDILSFISLSEFICVCSFDLFHRYDEVCRYNFNIHRYQSGLGHFSQLVWKDSEELGIGKYTGRRNGWTCTYIVARYRRGGNVNTPGGRFFRENVSKGSFRRSYCNNVSDKSEGEDLFVDAPAADDDDEASNWFHRIFWGQFLNSSVVLWYLLEHVTKQTRRNY